MMTFKFICEYDGTNFQGWQRQSPTATNKNPRTTQAVVEDALSKYFRQSIKVVASGRTDSGVHALGQVCSFEVGTEEFEPDRAVQAVNHFLPSDVSIRNLERASAGFNARFSAKRKTYVYKCYVSRTRRAVDNTYHHMLHSLPNINHIKRASKHFVGTHDFTAFSCPDTAVTDKVRTIYSLEVAEIPPTPGNPYQELCFVIEGDGFLRNMVRIIVGTLLDVGFGKIEPDSIPEILLQKDRMHAGSTAPAKGLVLLNVGY